MEGLESKISDHTAEPRTALSPSVPSLSWVACSFSGWCLSINWWKWQLLGTSILGDEAHLQLGRSANMVKHQPNLHWSLTVSSVRKAEMHMEGLSNSFYAHRGQDSLLQKGKASGGPKCSQVFQEV